MSARADTGRLTDNVNAIATETGQATKIRIIILIADTEYTVWPEQS